MTDDPAGTSDTHGAADPDGTAALAALLRGQSGLHDAELFDLRVEGGEGRAAMATLLLRDLWNGWGDGAEELDEAELRLSGAHLSWRLWSDAEGEVRDAPDLVGAWVLGSRLDGRQLGLEFHDGILTFTFDAVQVRTAPPLPWLLPAPLVVEATVLSIGGRGLLIRGPSAERLALAREVKGRWDSPVAHGRVELRPRPWGIEARWEREDMLRPREPELAALLVHGWSSGAVIAALADVGPGSVAGPAEEDLLGVRLPVLRHGPGESLAEAIRARLRAAP